MKKLVKYGYKLSEETLKDAIRLYGSVFELFNSKGDVKKEIERDKANGNIGAQTRPKIFKVTITLER